MLRSLATCAVRLMRGVSILISSRVARWGGPWSGMGGRCRLAGGAFLTGGRPCNTGRTADTEQECDGAARELPVASCPAVLGDALDLCGVRMAAGGTVPSASARSGLRRAPRTVADTHDQAAVSVHLVANDVGADD